MRDNLESFVLYLDESGEAIINTLTISQYRHYLSNKDNLPIPFQKDTKSRLVMLEKCTIYLVLKSKKPINNGLLDSYIQIFSLMVKDIKDAKIKAQKETRRLLHNIVSLNAHSSQEFDQVFLPEELIKQSQKKQLAYIQNTIVKNSKDTAKLLLKLAKNNTAIKSEFIVFNILMTPDALLRKSTQNLHRITKSSLDMFFVDFLEKNVNIELNTENDKIIEAKLNFDCLRFALYNILHNALKYTYPKTKLEIYIYEENSKKYIDFKMLSLKIKDHESDKIFMEGYSGEYAKNSSKSGSGLGLNLAQKILERINSKINLIRPSDSSCITKLGIEYETNIFQIEINEY